MNFFNPESGDKSKNNPLENNNKKNNKYVDSVDNILNGTLETSEVTPEFLTEIVQGINYQLSVVEDKKGCNHVYNLIIQIQGYEIVIKKGIYNPNPFDGTNELNLNTLEGKALFQEKVRKAVKNKCDKTKEVVQNNFNQGRYNGSNETDTSKQLDTIIEIFNSLTNELHSLVYSYIPCTNEESFNKAQDQFERIKDLSAKILCIKRLRVWTNERVSEKKSKGCSAIPEVYEDCVK